MCIRDRFTTDLLAQMIRFYGHAMQGMLGKYLETNIKSFVDFQKKLQDQSQLLYGESSSQAQNDMWSQFMNFQGPAMQTMMSTYMAVSYTHLTARRWRRCTSSSEKGGSPAKRRWRPAPLEAIR